MHLGKMGSRTAAAEVPVTSREESGGGKAGDIHLSKHSVLWHPGRYRAGLLHSLTGRDKDCTEEESIAVFIVNFGNGLPIFCCAQGQSVQLS